MPRTQLDEGRILNGINDAAYQAILALAVDIQQEATQLVPIDTGALQESIDIVEDEADLEVRVVAREPYARVIEQGGQGRPPRPYLNNSSVIAPDFVKARAIFLNRLEENGTFRR